MACISKTRLHQFYHSSAKSGYKIIQVDELNISRGIISNMAWEKNYPAFMLQDAPTKRYSVLVSISNTSIKRILIRCENTNGVIFAVFLQDLINDLKLKYDEYLVKLIIRWKGAKYLKVEEIWQIFRKIRKDVVITVPYT